MLSRVLVCRLIPSSLRTLKATRIQSSLLAECLSPRISQCFINLHPIERMYAQDIAQETMNVDYDYIQKATGRDDVIIVDVREPDEIKELGKIPNSVNIPLGNVTTVLGTMSENEFQKTYNKEKPSKNTEIIFYCMIGKRSGKAQKNAIDLGYNNTKNYLGSWNDWASKKQ